MAMNVAYLNIFVDPAYPELRAMYADHVEKHNTEVDTNLYYNAGFDLFVPETTICTGIDTTMIGLKVKAEMVSEDKHPCAFYLFPRSSISKTPLMLANHIGLIDSGYRGELIAAVRNLQGDRIGPYTVAEKTRLFQIVHPTAYPIRVRLVDDESMLTTTKRGSGGFGSTGGENRPI